MAASQNTSTFRFKFTDEMLNVLRDFSIVHQFDPPKVFKEAFEEFKDENKEIIDREKLTLFKNGYSGDVYVKMYKSARYYFKNKDYTQKDKSEKKRRKYIAQDRDFLNIIDEHVDTAIENNIKPSNAFARFIELYENEYTCESRRLCEYLEKDQIEHKIKKTYKNRYFISQKNN
jgi:hypothetical protein